MFYSVQSVLGRFLDIDHLITACVQIPKQDTLKTAENRIAYAIHLKHVLELVDPLRAALEEATNPLLVAYREVNITVYDSVYSVCHGVCTDRRGAQWGSPGVHSGVALGCTVG